MSALRVLCSARVTVKSVNSVASVQYARLWYSTKFCLWCCVWCLFRCFIHWHFGVSCASDLCKSKLSFLYLKKNHFTLDIIQGISTAISLLVYFCMSCHWSLLSKKKKKKPWTCGIQVKCQDIWQWWHGMLLFIKMAVYRQKYFEGNPRKWLSGKPG